MNKEEMHEEAMRRPVLAWVIVDEGQLELSPDEAGMEDRESFTADDVLDVMIEDGRGDVYTVVRDWDLLDGVDYDISVQVYDPAKRRWGQSKTFRQRKDEKAKEQAGE